MPHFFLMDEDKLSPMDAALLRSQLHIKAAGVLVIHGKLNHAIGTYYDALEFAMRWYILKNSNEFDREISYLDPDAPELFDILKTKFGDSLSFDFYHFNELMESSLESTDEIEIDVQALVDEIHEFLEFIGVMPFDLSIDPLEDENTRKIMGI